MTRPTTHNGNNFETVRTRRLDRNMAAIRAENARRIACPRCGLRILPVDMARHIRHVHDD